MKQSYWLFIINIVVAAVLGGVLSAINDGERIDAVILSMIFLVWFEVKDSRE